MTANKREDGEIGVIEERREKTARTLFALLSKKFDADWRKS